MLEATVAGLVLLLAPPRVAPAMQEQSQEEVEHPEPGEPAAAFRSRLGSGKRGALKKAPSGTDKAVERGLAWLAAHQSPDGSWENDGYTANCGKLGKGKCEGGGTSVHDVGATGLALLAFLGDGHRPWEGEHGEVVGRGLDWLVKVQEGNGRIGPLMAHSFLYDHAIATAALCEGIGLGAGWLRPPAERALAFMMKGQSESGGWRYDVPEIGDADTSMTGWAVNALVAARQAGLDVEPFALSRALEWIDFVTEADTGRVGYSKPGELSSRTPVNEDYPREKAEALTAVGLWVRAQCGQEPGTTAAMDAHARLIAVHPPEVDPLGNDVYYWYYATHGLQHVDEKYWKEWEKGLKKAVLGTQERKDDAEGSWAPVGPWAFEMGRVCTTALQLLTLESFVRGPSLVLDGV